MPSQGPTPAPTIVLSQVPSQVPSQFDNPKKISAPDAESMDAFGGSVDIHGDNIVIAAPFNDDNGNNTGSIYIFSKGGSFEEKIIASDGESEGLFGTSVALSENYIVVGSNSSISGGFHIIPLDDTSLMKKIETPNNFSEFFGYSVAISNNVIAIGSPVDSNENVVTGAVYLYTTDGTFIEKLTNPDGIENDSFGLSIAMADDVLVVGAPAGPGGVFVFNATNGEFLRKFVFESNTFFGYDVAVYGDTIVVGSALLVSIYSLDGTLIQQNLATDEETFFIYPSVAVSENVVVASGSRNATSGIFERSVYLFTTEGEFIERIADPDGEMKTFGSDVSIEGNRLVVGASDTIPGPQGSDPTGAGPGAGAAYIFELGL